jgi:uncharacterized protein (DUF736 family)
MAATALGHFFPLPAAPAFLAGQKSAPPPSSADASGLTTAAAAAPVMSQAIETVMGTGLVDLDWRLNMATIGTFKKTANNEFVGDIVTLSVQAKGVRIVPDTNSANENAPSHRVMVGRAEIGAAWTKQSNEGRDYLGLKLDDPSFNAPIYANLFDDEDGETFNLIWSRPTRRNGD